MSTENCMNPGELPAHLPVLTQIEEMIIARSHVQMLLHRYRGHQYHYTGHCVSFMQNTIKTVNMLPNLPSELDIIILRPANNVIETDARYRQQFRTDFRVCKSAIIPWLRFLQAHHPDYCHVIISSARLDVLPEDADVSASFTAVIEPSQPVDGSNTSLEEDDQPPSSTS
jgi:hypothetical protein